LLSSAPQRETLRSADRRLKLVVSPRISAIASPLRHHLSSPHHLSAARRLKASQGKTGIDLSASPLRSSSSEGFSREDGYRSLSLLQDRDLGVFLLSPSAGNEDDASPKMSELSLYDPLDLFSGSKERMSHAVGSLFTTPQNNFRVFLDGLLIYGGWGGYSEATYSLMDACERGKEFVSMLDGVIKASNDMRLSSFIELVTEAFHHSRVLNKLLEVQKLDLFDIKGAIHAYYDIISQPCNICKNLHDEEMIQRCSFFHSLPLEESLKIVREYLISVTAKDCSVMISFQPRRAGEMDDIYDSIYLTSTSQSFNYKVHFIDLDMKPLKKMVYHYELDQKITSCYRMNMVKAGAGNCECVQNANPRTGVIGIKHEKSKKIEEKHRAAMDPALVFDAKETRGVFTITTKDLSIYLGVTQLSTATARDRLVGACGALTAKLRSSAKGASVGEVPRVKQ
ncbi:hypothetical protein EJ110_NYTH39994, partial [Nymphaea thermarum]